LCSKDRGILIRELKDNEERKGAQGEKEVGSPRNVTERGGGDDVTEGDVTRTGRKMISRGVMSQSEGMTSQRRREENDITRDDTTGRGERRYGLYGTTAYDVAKNDVAERGRR